MDPSANGVSGVGLSLDHTCDALRELAPALDAFEAFGLDSVEVFLPSLGVIVGGRIRPAALAAMREVCAGRPYALTAHGPLCCNLGDAANAGLHRDTARRSLEAAAEAGARVLVIHACAAHPEAAETAMAVEAEALAALAPEAEAAGVVIGVETMFPDPGSWTPSPAELARTLAEVDSPWVGATIDFSHALLNAAVRGFDYLVEIAALAPHARHLHIHDSFGRPAPFRPWSPGDAIAYGLGDLHLPPGSGAVPWDALAGLPYGGSCVANIELDKRWADEWPEAIAWTRRWIASER
ncbi:MAG: sugar phosphate isomerase/epimerase [Rhodobacteraceae bacterium]|nr:MAG: sugar phosphate isomerase/epimerase [Paracoccaceae bacterium]